MELFQKIEALTGQKMEQHPAPEQDVMLMVERVSEAGRIAHLQVFLLPQTSACLLVDLRLKLLLVLAAAASPAGAALP